MSNITTVDSNFFNGFNFGGRIITLPTSFKRPALDSTNVNKSNVFSNAFNSPSYTLNRSVPLIVSGIATPNTNRATFSDNQPDRCAVDANWLVGPCTYTIDINSNGASSVASQNYTKSSSSQTKTLTRPTKNFTVSWNANNGSVTPSSSIST